MIEPTPRQKEMIQLMKDGKSQKQVADHLGLTYSSVRNQLQYARQRALARNTNHLIAICISEGWIK